MTSLNKLSNAVGRPQARTRLNWAYLMQPFPGKASKTSVRPLASEQVGHKSKVRTLADKRAPCDWPELKLG
jgi:hypothetical protein